MESLKSLLPVALPEIILISAACVLFLLGVSVKSAARRAAPWIAVVALLLTCGVVFNRGSTDTPLADAYGTFRVWHFAYYIKLLVPAIGLLLVLLAWPNDRDATGNSALNFGGEAGEFFGLMLLSLAGVLLVAGANDAIAFFLGIELASIPTYIMVSVSRPIAAAQEAGVKYFFLGAMSAALMLFGFSYLYGTTGTTDLNAIAGMLFVSGGANPGAALEPSPWQILALLMIVAGLAFKLAAVPLHFYAGDVYTGAATPVTAFLSFVPKITGVVALLKIMWVFGGGAWATPHTLAKLLWIMAVLTMFAGNLLGLLQLNVKRLLAYSSVAHSGYLLVGLATLAYAIGNPGVQISATRAVLFYLAVYGIMNVGVFAVLMMLPSRDPKVATSAETFEDLAGQGRNHPALGLAMAVGCFSLIGLPLTVGFFGKLYLIVPAWQLAGAAPAWSNAMTWLVVLTMINAAISAAYYLKIVATMFLRPEPPLFSQPELDGRARLAVAAPLRNMAVTLALVLSTAATLGLGFALPATQLLLSSAEEAVAIDQRVESESVAAAASPAGEASDDPVR